MKITKKQISLIKTAQKKLALDDSTYRQKLQANFNVNSCTKLTKLQAGKFIEMLRKDGFKGKKHTKIPRSNNKIIKMITIKEKNKITALANLIKWRTKTGLQGWTQKYYGFINPKTSYEAMQVIEGLKKMFERSMEKTYGTQWTTINTPEIQTYVQHHIRRL